MFSFLCWGDVGWDLYEGEVDPRPGGCSLNLALSLVACGAREVSVAAPLGSDGASLERILRAGGVRTDLVQFLEGSTPRQHIRLLRCGERVLYGYRAGVLEAPRSGAYHVGLRAVGWAQLEINGKTVIETDNPGMDTVKAVTMEQGVHNVRVRFKDTLERSRLHLIWQPPGQETLVPIPSLYLWPSQASYAEAALSASVAPPDHTN